MTDRRERIGLIRELLLARDWGGVAAFPASRGWLLRRLLSALQDPSPGLRWRAVVALGRVARTFPSGDPVLREFVRSLFWTMNDESGNLCRMAPEALGEILRARPEFRSEFAPLLPQYLVEEPFETGALWALCRLADAGWLTATLPADLLAPSLDHPDPRRRGLARRLGLHLAV